MRSLASVCLDSLAATASMISMSVTPSPASMEAHVLTVMGPTSARVLMATLASTARYDETSFVKLIVYIPELIFLFPCHF